MNHTLDTCTSFWDDLEGEDFHPNVRAGIAPAMPLLHISERKSTAPIDVYAQNCHEASSGAYTGESSAAMLKSIGITGVILGHSERREIYHESDALILAKMKHALSADLQVIYCCGEPLDIRKAGAQNDYIKDQLEASLLPLSVDQLAQVCIAYEPIWAIGTGETASAQQAQDMCAHIRSLCTEKYGKEAADKLHILYGGSVKPANAQEIFSQTDVDGGLVGGASLDSGSYMELLQIAGKLME